MLNQQQQNLVKSYQDLQSEVAVRHNQAIDEMRTYLSQLR